MTQDQEMSVIELLVYQKALITSLEKELARIKLENYKIKKINENTEERYENYYSIKINSLTQAIEEKYERYYSEKFNTLIKKLDRKDAVIQEQGYWILSKKAEIKGKETKLVKIAELSEYSTLKKEQLIEVQRSKNIKTLAEKARLKRIQSENKISTISE